MIIAARVDDCMIFAKDHEKVKEIIASLEDNFKLTNEGNLSAYLGTHITKNDDGAWALSQPFLIDRIIKALGLENDSRAHDAPATEMLASAKNENCFSEN